MLGKFLLLVLAGALLLSPLALLVRLRKPRGR